MTLLIADDHTVFREGLSNLLFQMKEVRQVLEASNGEEVLELLNIHKVDLVLMDISMPVKGGVETIREMKKGKFAEVPVIALTMFNRSTDILSLYDLDVNGYLLKDSAISEVWKAIVEVGKGGEYYAAPVKETLLKALQEREKLSANVQKEELTNREKEILVMICREMSTEEIAQTLFVSPLTVNNHRRNILLKTKAKNVAGLVFYALKHGIYKEE
ncbi:response regulator transcription factor [Fluviicola sp.]|uniref:response regulator transcription factor n=1 Tax=Fluviicola sp. TaxID=1917219 RepID=UPI0031D168EB